MKRLILPALSALIINTGCDKNSHTATNSQNESTKIETNINSNIIKVLVILDQNSNVSEAEINHQFNTTNEIFRNSNIDLNFQKSLTIPYDITSNNSNDTLDFVSNNQDIRNLKRDTKSQVAVVFSKRFKDACGVAWINNYIEERYTYAVLNPGCKDETMAHEIGHTFGLAHSIRQGEEPTKPYAHGYGVDGIFYTTMAYGKNFSTNNSIRRFSDSSREYEGFKTGNEGYSDSVRVIKENMNKYKRINNY